MSTPDDRDIRYAGQLAETAMKGLLETRTGPPQHMRLIELPEPAETALGISGWGDFEDIDGEPTLDVAAATGIVSFGMSNYTPDTARAIAKALLAAADTAEGKL